MHSHKDMKFYKEIGMVQYTEYEEALIDVQRTKKGIGYPQSNFQPYSQPSIGNGNESLECTLEREVTSAHAFAGTIPPGNKQIPCYHSYWEKRNTISNSSNPDNETAKDVRARREADTERLYDALDADGRVDADRLSRMSLEQLRQVAKVLSI